MADPSALRAGLARNLLTLGTDVQVSAYALSDPTPPTVMVDVAEIDYHAAMQNGHENWSFTVLLLVGYDDDIGAQKRLDELLPATKVALESDETLNGVAQDVTVEKAVIRTYALGGINSGNQTAPLLGAEFSVAVMA